MLPCPTSAAMQDDAKRCPALYASFATFDAEKATCYMPEDRSRLLGVIESGYGSLDEFNIAVRYSFSQRVALRVHDSSRR